MNYFLLESLFVIFEPVLALKLTHDYSYSSLQISWAFTILLVTSLVGASICVLLPEDLDKRKLILVTNLTLVVGVFCTGPSSLMHLPNSDIILLVGLGITGFSVGVSNTLSMVEAIAGGVAAFPSESVSVSQSVSKFLNAQFGVISLVFPPLSSLLYKSIGFNKTLDIFGLVFLVYYVSLLVWSAPE